MSSIVVSGLTNGHAYTVSICTENAIGKSKYLKFPSQVTPTASSLLPLITSPQPLLPIPIITSVVSNTTGTPSFTVTCNRQPDQSYHIYSGGNATYVWTKQCRIVLATSSTVRPYILGDSILVAPAYNASVETAQAANSSGILSSNFTAGALIEGSSYRIYVLSVSHVWYDTPRRIIPYRVNDDITEPTAAYTYIDVVYRSPANPSPPLFVSAIPYNTTALVSWSVPAFNGNNTGITYVVTATPV
jgi:hypothetical protein